MRFVLLIALTLPALSAPQARAVTRGRAGCRRAQCPKCGYVCRYSCEESKDKKHCWCVEEKPICIPPVRFPWASCCKPMRPARLRCVRVLKKKDYQCPSCKHLWTPEQVCCGCSAEAEAEEAGEVKPPDAAPELTPPELTPQVEPTPPAPTPTTLQPVTLQPATLQPATLQPATLQPATLQPATLQPAPSPTRLQPARLRSAVARGWLKLLPRRQPATNRK